MSDRPAADDEDERRVKQACAAYDALGAVLAGLPDDVAAAAVTMIVADLLRCAITSPQAAAEAMFAGALRQALTPAGTPS